ncbi:winged helix-turn-helix domain-containing protein [Streptomyces coelicoflavus]|uniref:helix-turn-helix domain-containing protein n=1 Tax=Streptomyces coelicoflavus TaxID=285562 RepID=UPI00210C3310|nr:winged helix-turn-helix domain-containing protein [Streptomyces coelicoflavus]MCQ4200364.1 winged helix-turn-helix domain-containing protein [Streptomyces coelicoflavus]
MSEQQFRQLEQHLARGAAAYGWPDNRWTLERVRVLIRARFDEAYTVQGVAKLLRRHGWYCQVPTQQTGRGDRLGGWLRGPNAKAR